MQHDRITHDQSPAPGVPAPSAEAVARGAVRRAMLAVALLRTVRVVRAARRAGRPVPLHQAIRLYRRHRCDLDPAWSPTGEDDATRYLREHDRRTREAHNCEALAASAAMTPDRFTDHPGR